MSEPTIAQKGPYPAEVEAGKSYYWCACGLSANQPFCDGSHKTTDMGPVKFEATETKPFISAAANTPPLPSSATAATPGCRQSAPCSLA